MLRTAITENGVVEGLPSSDARITVYKGIPYAAAPIGDNRWKAPKPCENWEGVKKAYTYGPIAVQDTPGLGTDVYCSEWHVDPDIPMSEDCLYLNIWTPAKSIDEKLPVLFWIHGGAYQWGYTAEMEFEGDRLAHRGMVVVSVGYRLAAFGFMAHKELTKESPDTPANFGLLDQQAALKWVYRNIAAFGGDKEQITLAGQSAGGASVLTQITCPDNYKYIKRAAILSGIIRPQYWVDEFFIPDKLEKAEELGDEFLSFMGVDSIEEARKLDALYIRDKYAQFAQNHMRMSLCLDGNICKEEPVGALANNKGADIPLLMGNTTNEFRFSIPAADEAEFKIKVKDIFKDMSEDFFKYEENLVRDENGYANIDALEANIKAIIELRSKKGCSKANYYYRFDTDIPGDDNPGCFHSVDLWFFFETLMKSPRPFVGRHYDLSRCMCNYLANFVKSGDPNGNDSDGSKMAAWEPYSYDSRNEMLFTSDGPKENVDQDARMRFFIDYALKNNFLRRD